MKCCTEYLTMNTPKRRDFVNITHRVEEVVAHSGVSEGLVLVNAMHITASRLHQRRRERAARGLRAWLEKLAPHEPPRSTATTAPARTTPTPT